jgi:hypothetical protein
MRRAAIDALALLAFVVVGVLTHDASLTAFGRDALCILGGWFAAAFAAGLYAHGGRRRLAVTWFAGVTAGVLVRAAIVARWPGAFYGVALAFTALFVLGGRALSRARP